MEDILKVNNLCKNGILNKVSFTMKEGEMIAIMGPSGAGKSTLLYNVSGMDQADAGEVWLRDMEIVSLSEDEKAGLRLKKMGFVFQQMNVLNSLNIIDNIMLPSMYASKNKQFRESQMLKALELMKKFGVEDLAKRNVNEVSGGQLQRICICRSMMMEPDILFADEPTGALNMSASEEVIRTFLQINERGTSILMVTHDYKVAAKCERILYILDGEIKGELQLGKYHENENAIREEKTSQWLKTNCIGI